MVVVPPVQVFQVQPALGCRALVPILGTTKHRTLALRTANLALQASLDRQATRSETDLVAPMGFLRKISLAIPQMDSLG